MAKNKREQYIVFAEFDNNGTKTYEAIGKDNEDMSRTMNNEVESFKNVLGVTEVTVTKGAQTTTVDPFKMESDSAMSQFLQDIYYQDLDGSDVEMSFIEVSLQAGDGDDTTYPAFRQTGAIDVKSIGGDTKGITVPFDINWKGERVYGTFNPTTKEFTAESA